jgi:hypothetical protein
MVIEALLLSGVGNEQERVADFDGEGGVIVVKECGGHPLIICYLDSGRIHFDAALAETMQK